MKKSLSQPRSSSFSLRVLLALATCALMAGSLFGPAGCDVNEKDPFYCPDRPNNYCACRSDSECSGGAPVCDVAATNTCVECTPDNAAACVGAKPICGDDNACRACSTHADCSSSVCLADGACAEEAMVAYVSPMGTDNEACSKALPCTKVAKALGTMRPYLKLSGTTNESLTISGSRKVIIYGDAGAKLRAGGSTSPILTVRDNGTSVTIYDLAISDAPNDANGYGVLVPTGGGAPSISLNRVTISNNPAGGISVGGGSLTVTQSTISGNGGGGIFVSNATFDITNNFIYRNGNQSLSSVGGLSVRPIGQSRLERNTVVDNQADAGSASAGGVFCDVPGFVAASNIIFRNVGGPTANVQTFGSCAYGNSFVMPGTSPVDEALSFARSNMQPFDYHLTAASPATVRDAGGACTGIDFDGDARPQGAACDLGADEYKAN